MTKEDLLANQPFWYAKSAPVIIRQEGKAFPYTGQLELIRQALPLTYSNKKLLDKNGNEFCEIIIISGPEAIHGQFMYCFKKEYGRFMIKFRELSLTPPKENE
jgi:hypothetical protein